MAAGVFVDGLSVNKSYTEDEKCFDDKIICDFSRINGSKYSPSGFRREIIHTFVNYNQKQLVNVI